MFLSLSRVLPNRYPLGDDVAPYVADENGFGRLLDYGIIQPRLRALYDWSARELGGPEVAGLLVGEIPAYAWDPAEAAEWTPPPRRLARLPGGRSRSRPESGACDAAWPGPGHAGRAPVPARVGGPADAAGCLQGKHQGREDRCSCRLLHRVAHVGRRGRPAPLDGAVRGGAEPDDPCGTVRLRGRLLLDVLRGDAAGRDRVLREPRLQARDVQVGAPHGDLGDPLVDEELLGRERHVGARAGVGLRHRDGGPGAGRAQRAEREAGQEVGGRDDAGPDLRRREALAQPVADGVGAEYRGL